MNRFARRADFPNSRQAVTREIFRFSRNTKSAIGASSRSTRGALRDRHERWARDAMDTLAAPDERGQSGRRSRVVLIPRRWDQVLR
jgi:hypothetical protein